MREYETGIRYDDPDIKIEWEFPAGQMVVSEKDKALPFFKELKLQADGF